MSHFPNKNDTNGGSNDRNSSRHLRRPNFGRSHSSDDDEDLLHIEDSYGVTSRNPVDQVNTDNFSDTMSLLFDLSPFSSSFLAVRQGNPSTGRARTTTPEVRYRRAKAAIDAALHIIEGKISSIEDHNDSCTFHHSLHPQQ